MRVMTFNVRRDVPDDGEHAWPHRRDRVAGVIRSAEPDLLGLQEPLAHQFSFLRERLAGLEWYGVGRTDGAEGGEHVVVGYDPDTIDVRERGTFWLSETPDEPSIGWDARHPRTVTWAQSTQRATDQSLLFCTTHFDHRGAQARRRSAHLLRERLAALANDRPVIVAGDFNATRDAEPLAILTAGDRPALQEAGTVAREPETGPGTTRTDFESLVPGRKIDHVLVSNGVTVSRQIVWTDGNGPYPSDHLPVIVDVSIDDAA